MAFYSSGVEYGIHSLMCMVDSRGDARDMSVREIAELQSVPYDYLAKIFTRLSKAGLVRSIEGKGGGFQLAKPAEHITVLDVVNAIDGDKRNAVKYAKDWRYLTSNRQSGHVKGSAVCVQ